MHSKARKLCHLVIRGESALRNAGTSHRNPKCDRCKVRDLCLEGSAQKQAEEKRRKKKPVKRRVKDDARDTDEEEASVEESEDEYRPS